MRIPILLTGCILGLFSAAMAHAILPAPKPSSVRACLKYLPGNAGLPDQTALRSFFDLIRKTETYSPKLIDIYVVLYVDLKDAQVPEARARIAELQSNERKR